MRSRRRYWTAQLPGDGSPEPDMSRVLETPSKRPSLARDARAGLGMSAGPIERQVHCTFFTNCARTRVATWRCRDCPAFTLVVAPNKPQQPTSAPSGARG